MAQAPPSRFDLVLPTDIRVEDYTSGAISPDGQRFVFEGIVNGHETLVVRNMVSGALLPLTDAQDGFRPFWSPDSQSIGFFTNDRLRRILATGEAVRDVCEVKFTAGTLESRATWQGDAILFSINTGPVFVIGATGGTARALDTLPWKPGQRSWVNPRFLPDGRHFLVNALGDPALYVASLDTPGTRRISDDASGAMYAAGHLLYWRGASLFARGFDPGRLAFNGVDVPIAEQASEASVSSSGTIVYHPQDVSPARLTWFTRTGQRPRMVGEPGPYLQLVLSPHGRHGTVVKVGNGLDLDLWDMNLETGILSRLTTNPANDTDPWWSPDERTLAFTSWRDAGRAGVFKKDLTSGREEPLVKFGEPVTLDQWTPDGQFIIFRTFGKAVYAMPLSGTRTPRMLTETPFLEDEVHVSPDGRWVAFDANESGRWEVYVARFPSFTEKRQVSNGGGVQPQWRGDSRELFYLGLDRSMMAVQVTSRPELVTSSPVPLFLTNLMPTAETPQYGVTADGQRFLGLERVGGVASFTFLVNWLTATTANKPGAVQ
jgi:Tol biopolymer transport system component